MGLHGLRRVWLSHSCLGFMSYITQGSLVDSDYKVAINTLTSLRIWNESALPGGLTGWMLNPTFRHNLKIGLLGG